MVHRSRAVPFILVSATLFIALSLGQPTRAAGPERPFKAYAPLMARDEPAPAPSGTGTPLATPVGAPTGTATSATIGAAGGVLSTPDTRLVLTIPAGALASATVISIQPITNNAPGRVGGGYRLTPNGQTFLKPITLSFAYTDEDLVGTAADFLGAAFQTAGRQWQWVGDATVDTTAQTASVSLSHFTDVSLTAGLQIFPAKKIVKTNGSVGLRVKVCYDPDLSTLGPGGASVGLDCDGAQGVVGTLSIDEWSVNGRPGGGGVFGTVSGNGATATYTAPSTVPIPNPVAVSARVHNPRRGSNAVTLVSSVITIADDSWTGTGTLTSNALDSTANVTWTLDSITNNVAYYKPTGTVTITTRAPCHFTPSDGVIDPNHGVLYIDYNAVPPTYRGWGTEAWPATLFCAGVGIPGGAATVYFGGIGTAGGETAGAVTGGGSIIEGSHASAEGTVRWKFTRDR